MTVIEREPETPERIQEKRERPPVWAVVLNNPYGIQEMCPAVCVLKVVFNHSTEQALKHLREATNQGSSMILTGPADAMQYKAGQAETYHLQHTCHPCPDAISFSAERLDPSTD